MDSNNRIRDYIRNTFIVRTCEWCVWGDEKMMFTDDPLRDFENWDAEQEEALSKLPICEICEEHIQQETAICIDGKWYCDHCLNEYCRKDVEDYG